jgi:Tfp pilus assembly protein PilV
MSFVRGLPSRLCKAGVIPPMARAPWRALRVPRLGVTGATMIEAAMATALAAVTIVGVGAAWQAMVRSDQALSNRMRAALIADAALELMRAGHPQTVALAHASRDASRQLLDGTVTVERDPDGANVLMLEWSELATDASQRAAACRGTIVPPDGYVRRCLLLGFLE